MKNNNLQVFNFEGHSTRIVMKDGETWFVAKDIAEVLGYQNPSRSVKDHCKHSEVLKNLKSTDLVVSSLSSHGGVRRLLIIPKSDVYRLIARSKLPAAQKFEERVTHDAFYGVRIRRTTKLTGKGQLYFANKFCPKAGE